MERAQSVGAKFIWNRTVVSVVPPADSSGDGERSVSASVTLCSGRVLTADLVIGADGAQSIVRKLVDEGAADGLLEAKYTGTTIYTGIMDTADIMADPTMADIVPLRHPFWMGDNCIAMGTYLIRRCDPHSKLITNNSISYGNLMSLHIHCADS